MKNWIILGLLIVMMTCIKCTKNDDSIPLTTVDVTVNIIQPAYFDLQVVGGWEYLNGGSMGLLVYRQSTDVFKAYDRHSTYRPDDYCRVYVDSTNVFAVDECSDSRFVLTDGSVETGPASIPLKEYTTTFNGSILQIYN